MFRGENERRQQPCQSACLCGEVEKDGAHASSVFGVCVSVWLDAGLRGATCDVMIAEEAAYLNPKMFMEAMVPLMSVDGTAFLGITSPGDEQNHFSLLQSLKDPKGEDLFFNIKIGLICEPCLEARLTTCRHNLRRLPPWKSEARHDIVRAIYGHNKVRGEGVMHTMSVCVVVSVGKQNPL